MRQDLLKGLSKEQIEKLNQCRSGEEILELAKKEGIELTDEQLAAVNGGACDPDGNINNPGQCPRCNGTNTKLTGKHDMGRIAWDTYYCSDCDAEYRVVQSAY